MEENQKVPFYKKTWFIILALILFFPLGLVLMWTFSGWSKVPKWIVTGVFAFFIMAAVFSDPEEIDDSVASGDKSTEEQSESPVEEEPVKEEESIEDETGPIEEESTEEESTEEESVEEGSVPEEEVEEKEEPVEELTPEEEIENVINESLGEENISELNVTEYDGNYEVDVTFTASENFSAGMTANGIRRDIVDTTLDLKGMEHYVSYLLLTATLPLTDDSGNESDGQVMAASFEGSTIEELNADNEAFLYDNLESAADGYSAHPQFR